MKLDALVKISGLKPHVPSSAETKRLLAAIDRSINDASVESVSDGARFDAAYKAIIQCALVTLMASGFRPLTNVPGQHQTLIRSLEYTLGLRKEEREVLDTLRGKHEANDSTGGPIDPAALRECASRAEALAAATRKWLNLERPTFLER